MRLLYFIRKEFIELFRQKELRPLLIIAPLVQIILLGYVVNTDIEKLPVKIINLSESKVSRELIRRVDSSPLFDITEVSGVYNDPMEDIRSGSVKAVLYIRDALNRSESSVPQFQILMDGMDSNTSLIASGYINGILQAYFNEASGRAEQAEGIVLKPLIRYNPDLRSVNYMGPGIVALLLTILTLFLTSVSIVREKEQGTMDTLFVSELRPVEIYIGKAVPMGVVGILEMFFGVLIVSFWFDIPVAGNLFYLLIAAVVFLCSILSYALLISILANTQQQALFFSWFSMVTFIMLSGLFTPYENIHPVIKPVAAVNPLRYLIKIIREIFIKGNGIEYFFSDLGILIIIACVITLFSINVFRKAFLK